MGRLQNENAGFQNFYPHKIKERTLSKIEGSECNSPEELEEDLCPFTLEPFSTCKSQKGFRNTRCPFSLDVCMKEQSE